MKSLLIRYFPLIVLVVVGAYLRTSNLAAVTTFEWDQARDVGVMSEITQGKLTLIGPVVRGEGSFFLGPLYYYLGAFLLLLASGDPLILVIFAVVLDLLVGIAIYLMLSRKSVWQAIFATSVWMSSLYLVKIAHVPWNVSLLELWMMCMILFFNNFAKHNWARYAFFLFAGFSTHIHLSLVGMTLVFLLGSYELIKKMSRKELIFAALLLLLPLVPLIIFDLRHDFLESSLLLQFLKGGQNNRQGIFEFLGIFITKLDYTLSEFLLSSRVTWLGIIAMFIALIQVFRKKATADVKLLGGLLLATPAMLLLYRDPGFAEYYLMPMFIPLLLLLSSGIAMITLRSTVLYLGLAACALVMSFKYFDPSPVGFSLAAKTELAEYIAEFASSVDLRLEAPPGRRDGISYLLARLGVKITPTSPHLAIISETGTVISEPQGYQAQASQTFGSLQVAIFAVQ